MSGRKRFLVPAFLCAAVFAAFWPVLRAGFVNWDDGANLLANPHYRGLGWNQFKWMLSAFYGGCYQPLSWLSYDFDYLLWGLNPLGYHLTNLVLHSANAVLLYFIARRLLQLGAKPADEMGLSLAAAFGALFFAIHPLRVESVAWVTERRDVLSGTFYLAALLFYLRRELPASWACFFLALLSKATGVALPIVFLILDVYPLRRFPRPNPLPKGEGRGEGVKSVLFEKIPFFILSAVFGAAALKGQRAAQALMPLARYNLTMRLEQSILGFDFYLLKTFIPTNLSPLYPIPVGGGFPAALVCAAAAMIAVLICIFIHRRKKWPASLAALACYAVLVAPVLGIFQSGSQFAADRYTYLPCMAWALLVGAAVLFCWQRLSMQIRRILVAVLGVMVLGLGLMTRSQAAVWHDSFTLWSRALELTPNDFLVHMKLGAALAEQGNTKQAVAEYQRAIALNPKVPGALVDLGNIYIAQGKPDEAIHQYEAALFIAPDFGLAHYNLGIVLAGQKKIRQAAAEYELAVKFDPGNAQALVNLGNILAEQGNTSLAIAQYQQAIKIDPNLAQAHFDLGAILVKQGKIHQAAQEYKQALKLSPGLALPVRGPYIKMRLHEN